MSADRDAPLAHALHPHLTAGPGGVLLAVSGGPDSTALLHAAARSDAGRPIHVATVDHRLRPDSAAEAEAVGRMAEALGLPHRVLVWDAPVKGRAVQEAARAARYELLGEHARSVGATTILTGHTADDQAETVLLRLAAGSGPAGLAGMRRLRDLGDGVVLVRPFLHLPKAELVAYCERHSLAFARDPSNADPRFARARLRRSLPALAEEGLTTARLCRLAERTARDQDALSRAARLLFEAVRSADADVLVLDGARLGAEPEALALSVVGMALDAVLPDTAASAHARLERLERLVLGEVLPALAARRPLRRTLRGVLVEATASGRVRFTLAPPRRDGVAAGGPDLLGKGKGAAYIGPERVE